VNELGALTVAPTPQMREKKKRPSRICLPLAESGARLGCSGTSIQMSRCASMSRMHARASIMSIVGTGERQSLRRYQRIGSRNHAKRARSRSFCDWSTLGGSCCSHDSISGSHPSECGSMYTIPHRLPTGSPTRGSAAARLCGRANTAVSVGRAGAHETVAGEATARSIGSKIRFIMRDMAMISPDIRQSFLLSSSTVFMFSIQMAAEMGHRSTE
jgi:hypothetical protein